MLENKIKQSKKPDFESYEKALINFWKDKRYTTLLKRDEFIEWIENYLQYIINKNQFFKENESNEKEFPTLEWLWCFLWINIWNERFQKLHKDILVQFKQFLTNNTLQKLLNKDTYTSWQIFYIKNIAKEHYKDKLDIENNVKHTFSLKDIHNKAKELPEDSENVIEMASDDDIY